MEKDRTETTHCVEVINKTCVANQKCYILWIYATLFGLDRISIVQINYLSNQLIEEVAGNTSKKKTEILY